MNWEEWFQNAWTVREEQFYQSFFGPNSGGIYPLDHHVFAGFAKGDVDPRWLTHGVIKFPPTTTRRSWLYATSGLSNAWDDEEPNPDGWSGLGCELIIEASADFDWALSLLRRLLAFQILLGWGRYEGKEPLVIGDRIPLRNSIDGEQSPLTWCLVAPPVGYPAKFQLPSGNVEFLHLVGVTEVEAQFAKENGYEELLRRISPVGYPVTNPARGNADCS
jgi:hypothetical protein